MIKTDETMKLSPVLHQPLLLVWTKVMVDTVILYLELIVV